MDEVESEASSNNKDDAFVDLCKAWINRFPGCDPPASWELDVRANLALHRTRVLNLTEDLKKEEMYVAYLNNLLTDIEAHQNINSNGKNSDNDHDDADPSLLEVQNSSTDHPYVTVINVSPRACRGKTSFKKYQSSTIGSDSYSDQRPSNITKPCLNLQDVSDDSLSSLTTSPVIDADKCIQEINSSIYEDPNNFKYIRGQPDGRANEDNSSPSGSVPRHNKLESVRSVRPAPPPPPTCPLSLSLDGEVKTRRLRHLSGEAHLDRIVGQAGNVEPLYDVVSHDTSDAASGYEDNQNIMVKSHSVSTLSSSDNDNLDSDLHEDECHYVNIQFFMEDDDIARQKIKSETDDELKNVSTSQNVNQESETERREKYKYVLDGIVDSESGYVECLSVMLQYMKAMKVTYSTDQPVIPKEDFDAIFMKIPELYELHFAFLKDLKKQLIRSNGVGHAFRMLAGRTKIYGAFLKGYPKALKTLRMCNEQFPKFAELTRSIKLRALNTCPSQSLSLEEMLYKPIARVQRLCCSLPDIIKFTPPFMHSDIVLLKEALALVQDFLNEYNFSQAGDLFSQKMQQKQRVLVKNSFIVELYEGVRKLRHLFLFSDVLVCAKYKPLSGGGKNEKFSFQLKWYVPLDKALIMEDPDNHPKESSPVNVLALKTQTSIVRDQIYNINVQQRKKSNKTDQILTRNRARDKLRKKLAQLEVQLVLASPALVFQIAQCQGKTYTFYMSSEYERSQWVETLKVLQSSLSPLSSVPVSVPSLSTSELQGLITKSHKCMGSFLMRSSRDEPLLIGELYVHIDHMSHSSQILTPYSDNVSNDDVSFFITAEVDSYGHFFKKFKTSKSIKNDINDQWTSSNFIVELEGSENLRLLLYENSSNNLQTILRGRNTIELSRSWLLCNKTIQRKLNMGDDIILTVSMRFVSFEETLSRVSRPIGIGPSNGLFGTPIHLVSRREKRPIPFIIGCCVREMDRRGISEVGVYRISGSSTDIARLKKAFEVNAYEAEQLAKQCDIHSVAGVLKLFLRNLPESLFTSVIYNRMFKVYNDLAKDKVKQTEAYLHLYSQIPESPNQKCLNFLMQHIVEMSKNEAVNKMSLHNLAMVFGPTLLHAGCSNKPDEVTGCVSALYSGTGNSPSKAEFTNGTVDVMAQAAILHFFLLKYSKDNHK